MKPLLIIERSKSPCHLYFYSTPEHFELSLEPCSLEPHMLSQGIHEVLVMDENVRKSRWNHGLDNIYPVFSNR